jgi:hypothetical protein
LKVRSGRRIKAIKSEQRCDFPRIATLGEADSMDASDLVLGVQTPGGHTRAYPVALLGVHIINDTVEDEPVLVTYCPRCLSGLAFEPQVGGQRLFFWVFGRERYRKEHYLYRVVFADESGTVWTQEGEAIHGPHEGTRLQPLATELTSWGEWRRRNPTSSLMLGNAPKGGPVLSVEQRIRKGIAPDDPLETLVLGVKDGDIEIACAVQVLAQAGGLLLHVPVENARVLLLFDARSIEGRAFWWPSALDPELAGADPIVVRDVVTGDAWDITGRPRAGGQALRPLAKQRLTRLYGWLLDHPESRVVGVDISARPQTVKRRRADGHGQS